MRTISNDVSLPGLLQQPSHSPFILESLQPIGSPACLLYEYIQAFIAHDDVSFEEVVFNFGDIKWHAAHEHVINQLVQHLSVNTTRRVVIFITNHSHGLTGDLYISPDSCAPVPEVSM